MELAKGLALAGLAAVGTPVVEKVINDGQQQVVVLEKERVVKVEKTMHATPEPSFKRFKHLQVIEGGWNPVIAYDIHNIGNDAQFVDALNDVCWRPKFRKLFKKTKSFSLVSTINGDMRTFNGKGGKLGRGNTWSCENFVAKRKGFSMWESTP